jgi:hypothetical protein
MYTWNIALSGNKEICTLNNSLKGNAHLRSALYRNEEICLLNGALNGNKDMYMLNMMLKGNMLKGALRSPVT